MVAAAPPAVRLGFCLAVTAVCVQFVVSSNVLFTLGVHYDVPGGNPLMKFHPATYLAAVAALATVCEQGGVQASLARLLRESPTLVAFMSAMLFCTVYSAVSVGSSGTAIFIENYVSAGLLAFALAAGNARARRTCARVMLILCLANVVVAVGETLVQTHLIPVYLGGTAFKETANDFRGTAGFNHPLTGAAVTMLTILLLPIMRLRAWLAAACFLVLSVGLLGFGGRAALACSIAAFAFMAADSALRGLVARRYDPKRIAGFLFVIVMLPLAACVVLAATPIADRLVSHLYLDSSAEVRATQWRVLDYLSLRDVLLGMPESRLPEVSFAIGIEAPTTDIENPWLLTFLKLGFVGLTVYVAGLLPFLFYLWRRSAYGGRVVLVCGLVVISSNNSLGHKSNLLFLLTAFTMAATGFEPGARMQLHSATAPPRARQAVQDRVPAPSHPNAGRGLRPARLRPSRAAAA